MKRYSVSSWPRPSFGAVLSRRKGMFSHKGLYLSPMFGSDVVIHNTPEQGIVLSTFEEYANGEVVVEEMTASVSPILLLERVRAELAAKLPYCPITNNCEHLINRLVAAKNESSQVIGWGLAGIGLAVFAVFGFAAAGRRA